MSGHPPWKRALRGAGYGVFLGLFYAVLSRYTDPQWPFRQAIFWNSVGGAAGGAIYGLSEVLVTNRVFAGVAMAVAASVACTVAFYGYSFEPYWGMGPLLGVSAGLCHGVLFWKPESD